MNLKKKKEQDEASHFRSHTLFYYNRLFPWISDGHHHVRQEVLQGQPLQAVTKSFCVNQLTNATINVAFIYCVQKRKTMVMANLKVLCTHRAFKMLAFLQPKPDNIMLILCSSQENENHHISFGLKVQHIMMHTLKTK